MRTCSLLLLLIIVYANTFAQEELRKTYFPAWTFQQKNIRIYGISAGLITLDEPGSARNVRSNGLRIEPLGMGILIGFLDNDPLPQNDDQYKEEMSKPLSEKINGINLSPAGTLCDCAINGISAGLVGQFGRQVNGVSASMINIFQLHNGLQMGAGNIAYAMNGVQLAVFNNSATKANGIQIGFLTNRAERANGLQIALFNHAKQLKGVQIGLWNVNQKRKLPLVNWNFN
jgi:hypothetical protein